MASGDERANVPEGLDGIGLRIGVVRARWNVELVDRLAAGVRRGLDTMGVEDVVEVSVPGSLEIPLAAQALATRGEVDAVVCIGAVVRGDTTHYELVSENCARGVAEVQLATGVPVMFGLLTVENREQAMLRSRPDGGHNVGEEAALGAVEMARLVAGVGAPVPG
ncbi:MAG: 6,7-dimethyl-8-ribityllumazine synthase [Acidimicrobiales bacterium]